jgi:hypothetical protein
MDIYMNSETKIGIGMVALVVLCCAGPLVLSLVATGVVLGALGAIWAQGRPLLLGSAAIAIALCGWLVARRNGHEARAKPAGRKRRDWPPSV